MGGGETSYTPATMAVYQKEYTEPDYNNWLDFSGYNALSGIGTSNNTLTDLYNNYYQPFLQGNYNLESMPGFSQAYDAIRGQYEDTYKSSKESALENTARGGSMTDALSKLDYQKARDTGQATSKLGYNLLNNLWTGANELATGNLRTSGLQSLSSAANTAQSGINTDQNAKVTTDTNNLNALMTAAAGNQAAATKEQTTEAATSGKSGLGSLGTGIGSILGSALGSVGGPVGTALGGALGGALGSATSSSSGSNSSSTSGLGGWTSLWNSLNSSVGSW